MPSRAPLAYAAGTLTIYGVGHMVVERLGFQGSLSAADFTLGADGHGGTDITDPSHTLFRDGAAPVSSVAAVQPGTARRGMTQRWGGFPARAWRSRRLTEDRRKCATELAGPHRRTRVAIDRVRVSHN